VPASPLHGRRSSTSSRNWPAADKPAGRLEIRISWLVTTGRLYWQLPQRPTSSRWWPVISKPPACVMSRIDSVSAASSPGDDPVSSTRPQSVHTT
jgi:hypothetical protein